jgi:hypothetical protein
MKLFPMILLLARFLYAASFATHYTSEQCDRKMDVGVLVMGKPIEISDERKLIVFRNGVAVSTGETVESSDLLNVKIEPKSFQIVFEIKGGPKFKGVSGCGGIRTNTNDAQIDLSKLSTSTNISISGIWAKSYSGGVKLLNEIELFVNNKNDEL